MDVQSGSVRKIQIYVTALYAYCSKKVIFSYVLVKTCVQTINCTYLWKKYSYNRWKGKYPKLLYWHIIIFFMKVHKNENIFLKWEMFTLFYNSELTWNILHFSMLSSGLFYGWCEADYRRFSILGCVLIFFSVIINYWWN